MEFNLMGQGDNLLMVSLKKNESVACESDAMVMMEGNLDLVGEMRGGFWQAVGRKFTNGESFFTQKITASRGDGDTLLAPLLPGDIHILECDLQHQYFLNDGVFMACDTNVSVSAKMQSTGRALFGGTGGFFVGETSGVGKLAVSGYGTIFELTIDNAADNPVIVDNNHVVAWDRSLRYEISLKTKKSKDFLSSLVNSTISGEGIVNKFSGQGKIVICSRNRRDFVNWIASHFPQK